MPTFLSNTRFPLVDATQGYRHGTFAPLWKTGTGTPQGVVAAPVGSLYSRLDGGTDTTVYRKEAGTDANGWIAISNAGGVVSVDGRTGVVTLADKYVDVTGDTMTGDLGLGVAPTSKLHFAVATTAAGGIQFGSDTNLYRSAPDMLRTDDSLSVGVRVDATLGFRHGSSTTPSWTTGTGAPEGTVTAPIGSLYSRTDGSTGTAIYRKETGTGNTGWIAISSASGVTSVDGRTGTVTLSDLYVDVGGDNMTGNLGLGFPSPTAKLQFAAATAAAGGISFGTDVTLYRSAPSTLSVGGALSGSSTIAATGGITSGAIVQAALSTTAGGFRHGASGPVWIAGTNTPEGVVTAVVGSMFSRTNGSTNTTLYRKETGTGNTGWLPVVAAGSTVALHATTHYTGGTDPITGALPLATGASTNSVILGAGAAPFDAAGTTAVGVGTMAALMHSAGSNNTAIGWQALSGQTFGNNNVGIGATAGNLLAFGNGNVVIGSTAALDPSSTRCTAVGYGAATMLDNISDAVAIGAYAYANYSGSVAIGCGIGGQNVAATAQYDFVLGMALHKVRVPGSLGIGVAPTAKLHFAEATDAANGILFGADTNLYRSAPDTLTTDDSFTSGASVQAALSTSAGGYRHGATGPTWTAGAGTPEGVVTAPIGSLFSRTNGATGTALYRKETGTGATGWVATAASGGGGVTSVDGRTGVVTLADIYVNVTGDTMTGQLNAPTIALGTSPSTAGTIRLAKDGLIQWRKTDNTGDAGYITQDPSDSTVYSTPNWHRFYCAGAVALDLRSTGFAVFPDVVGDKIQWYSGAYKTGIAANTLYHDVPVGNNFHEFRVGGVGKAQIKTASLTLAPGVVAESPSGFRFGSTLTPSWTSGAGTPEGAVAAPVGSMYSRTDGAADTAVYRKETGTGATGWVPIADVYVATSAPAGTPNSGDLWYDTDEPSSLVFPISVAQGGTGGTSPTTARSNLSVPYVGNSAITAGAPTTGTYVRGDNWLDSSNVLWVCTVDGSPGTWISASAGEELAYNQIVANATITTTTAVVIEGTSRTYDGSPLMIEFCAYRVQSSTTAGAGTVILLWDGGTDLGGLSATVSTTTSIGAAVCVRRRITPTPGTHNYRIMAYTVTGTATLYAGAGGAPGAFSPAYIQVTRA